MPDPSALYKRLAYTFHDPDLLKAALTHRSAGRRHYERLEFLGDAILNLIITDDLYHRFTEASEGKLSRLRSTLVKGETLSVLARKLELGDFLILGSGELKSGGYRRNSILADVFESIIGAIYTDAGYEAAKSFVLTQFKDLLAEADISKNLKDPKTRLQELLQSRGNELPVYEVVGTSGQAHNQTFTVTCTISLLPEPTEGSGSSRRKAEQAAARQMLEQLDTVIP